MTTQPESEDRRQDVRLASRKAVEAVLVDRYDQPIEVLPGAQVLNVSARGLAILSDQPTDVGSQLKVIVNPPDAPDTPDVPHASPLASHDAAPIRVEALDCRPYRDHHYKIRCRLVSGMMPAALIYGW